MKEETKSLFIAFIVFLLIVIFLVFILSTIPPSWVHLQSEYNATSQYNEWSSNCTNSGGQEGIENAFYMPWEKCSHNFCEYPNGTLINWYCPR
jgi:hypothetical protein